MDKIYQDILYINDQIRHIAFLQRCVKVQYIKFNRDTNEIEIEYETERNEIRTQVKLPIERGYYLSIE